MLETEFVKSMNSNYERIRLDKQPDEKRYQYCMLNRGGIKGLLDCKLHYINGDAYLYYDISSLQNICKIFHRKKITRDWLENFLWNMKQINKEINRFLLDESNLIWYPETVYQDIDTSRFQIIYYPYYAGESSFRQLLEFFVEHIDYSDEKLVEFVYKMYEQYDLWGDVYLQNLIYNDLEKYIQMADSEKDRISELPKNDSSDEFVEYEDNWEKGDYQAGAERMKIDSHNIENGNSDLEFEATVDKTYSLTKSMKKKEDKKKKTTKKSIVSILKLNKEKQKSKRDEYFTQNYGVLEGMSVAEETDYYLDEEETDEHTVYIDNLDSKITRQRMLCSSDGQVLCRLSEDELLIGKSGKEADLVVNNDSVSRMHARIYYEEGEYYLEDLNSTNGSFKNGFRLNPYECKQLLPEDEIRLGSEIMFFR